MPFDHYRLNEDTVVSKFYGTITADELHEGVDCMLKAYEDIGDSVGLILDLSEKPRLGLGAMRAAQSRVHMLKFKIPSAILTNNPNGYLATFLQMLDNLNGRWGNNIFFCKTQEEALVALDSWFIDKGLEREQLRGIYEFNEPESYST